MQCPKPITLKTAEVPVPCGRCFACLERRRKDWAFRLGIEQKVSSTADFITLTYANDYLPIIEQDGKWYQTLLKTDVQKFMKRLRKKQKEKITYYMVGEYGPKGGRPHYHYLMFNLTESNKRSIQDTWGLGHVDKDEVTPASIMYVAGYLINDYNHELPTQKPFALMSKGIGKSYEHNKKYHKENERHYAQYGRTKIALPRYYRNKFFTEEEKQIHNEKMAAHLARKDTDRFDKIIRNGQNPITYIPEQIKNEERKSIKNNKQNRKL